MNWKFTTIEREDGRIKGQTKDGDVVILSDEGWTDAPDTGNDPKWIEITEILVEELFDSDRKLEGESQVEVNPETAVSAITGSSIVNHEDKDQEELKASLLIEYLASEDVFSLTENSLTLLKDPTTEEGMTRNNYRNWKIFMQTAHEYRDSLITKIDTEKDELAEEFEGVESPNIQEDYNNLIRDLVQISDNQLSRESVADNDIEEYERKMERVETLYPAVEGDDDITKVEAIIGKLLDKLKAEQKVLKSRMEIYAKKDIEQAAKQIRDSQGISDIIDIDPTLKGEDLEGMSTEKKRSKLLDEAEVDIPEEETLGSQSDEGPSTVAGDQSSSEETTRTETNDEPLSAEELDEMVSENLDESG